MKLRTQLIAGIVIFALLLVIISAVIITTNQQLENLMVQEDLANNIALQVGELNYLSNDYILYRETPQAERWNAKYDSIAGAIALLSSDQPEQRVLASNLASNLRNTRSVFDEIVSSPVQSGELETGFVQLSWSRIAVQNQGMVFDAGRLARLVRDQETALRAERLISVFALMGTFVAFILTSYFLFYRRTVQSISNLQNGAQAVGSGNFSYTIEDSSDNEIGDLARSFNRMITDLNTITASKAELEREVVSRKRAEEDLVYANDRLIRSEQDLIQRNVELNALNEEVTAAQEELQQNVNELTRAEQDLRETGARLESLYASMNEGLAIHDIVYAGEKATDYIIRDVNPAFEAITGIRKDDAVGMSASKLYGTGQPPFLEVYSRVASGGGPERFETPFPPMKKHFAISVFSPGRGKFATIFSDITDRKSAEEALRKSEEEYRHVVEYAPASIYEISRDGLRFLRVNDAMCRILGYTREELMGMSPSAILDPESGERFRERIQKRSSGEDIDESVAYRVLAKDGRVLWVTLNIKIDHGTGENTLVVAHDITERKQAEETLQTTLRRFYTILSNMRYGILLVTGEERIEFVNQAFCELFGLPESPEDLTDLSSGEMIERIKPAYRDPEAEVARIGEIVRRGDPVRSEEVGMQGNRTILRDFIPLQFYKQQFGRLWIHMDITERKKAEDALCEAHQRTATILEGIADTFYSLDSKWRFTTVNPAAEKAPFARPASELLGRVIWDLYPELVGTRIHRHYLDAAGKHTMEHYEAQSPINKRWYEVFMQGRNGGVDISMRDITDRKQAEEALRETSQYLDNLINYANAPIIVWDPAFRITRFNHAFELLTGMAAGEAIGQHLSIVFPVAFRDAALDVVKRTMAGERLNVVELPIIRKDGHVSVVLWNSATLYEADGTTVSSTIAQGHDITERKIAEEALRESEALAREHLDDLASVIEAVPAAVWIAHDPEALHITGNALSDDWLRIPHGAEASKSAPEGERPETFMMFRDGREMMPSEMPVQRSAGGAEIRNYEFDFVYTDGTRRTVLGNSTPLKDAEGNPRGSVSSFIDITDRKRSEEELKRRHNDLSAAYEEITATQEELHRNVEELSLREQELLQSEAKLKDALTEKEILLSEIHHRVKNNLAAFISLLSLDGTYEDTEAGRALRKDLQNRARSMALIHETLYRTGKFSNVDMETYLSTLIDQIAATFRGKVVVHTVVNARGVVLDLARATTAGLIINELVTNSFKYAFPPSFDCMEVRGEPCTIRVSFTGDDGTLLLSVADNGRGLPPDLDPLTAKSLGLRLVNFLARHQLRAEVAVRENKGTEFIFRFNKTEDHP